MSQNPTQTRPAHRRRKSSGFLANVICGLILIVACVYGIWGIRPLQHVWVALGFGKLPGQQTAGQLKTPRANSGESESWTGTRDKSNVPLPPLPLAELPGGVDDTPPNPFLSNERLRPGVNVRRPSVTGSSEPELDRRFEIDVPNVPVSNVNSIRTADFEEPANAEPPRRKRRPHKQIQFEVDDASAGPEVIDDTGIRQIGDQTDAVEQQPAASNRLGVRAKPASAPIRVDGPIKLNEVTSLIDAGRDAEAYDLLATAYTQHAADRPRFQELLDKTAQRIYFAPQPQIEPPYEIQAGDQLRKIATKYHVSWQYLSKLNQTDARKIRPGKMLKVFQGPFSASVDLSDFELVIFLKGRYVKRYQVGVGKDNSSPLGEFIVKDKLENPTYYGPEGNVLAADDPRNPLGERWIDIGNSFGIHGTIEPDSIGKSDSAGCIRMRNEEVAEVYDLLTVGSPVTIQR